MSKVRPIGAWQTTDRQVFVSEDKAISHQEYLDTEGHLKEYLEKHRMLDRGCAWGPDDWLRFLVRHRSNLVPLLGGPVAY